MSRLFSMNNYPVQLTEETKCRLNWPFRDTRIVRLTEHYNMVWIPSENYIVQLTPLEMSYINWCPLNGSVVMLSDDEMRAMINMMIKINGTDLSVDEMNELINE